MVKKIIFKTLLIIIGIPFWGYILLGDKLENYYGQLNEDETEKYSYTIVKFEGIKRNITIPATIRKLPVTKIGEQAFCGVDLVEIFPEIFPGMFAPDPLEKLKKRARGAELIDFKKLLFEKTRGKIKSVFMPNSIISIGDYAFDRNKINRVVFSENLEYIGSGAFTNNELSAVELPSTVAYIGPYAFAGNKIEIIDIGFDVIMHADSFQNDFLQYYIKNDRMAGRYILKDGEWGYQEKFKKLLFLAFIKKSSF